MIPAVNIKSTKCNQQEKKKNDKDKYQSAFFFFFFAQFKTYFICLGKKEKKIKGKKEKYRKNSYSNHAYPLLSYKKENAVLYTVERLFLTYVTFYTNACAG